MPEITVRRVVVEPLEPAAFEPFGVIIDAGAFEDETLNRAPGQMAFLWVLKQLEFPKTPYVAGSRYIYRGARCDYLQQHPESTAVLIPLDGRPSVIFAAPDHDGEPDLDGARAFLLDGRRGIVFHRGTWVRYAYPVLDVADYAYVSARVDPSEDIRHVYIERDQSTVLEWYFGPPAGDEVTLSPGGVVLGLPRKVPEGFEIGEGGRIQRPTAG